MECKHLKWLQFKCNLAANVILRGEICYRTTFTSCYGSTSCGNRKCCSNMQEDIHIHTFLLLNIMPIYQVLYKRVYHIVLDVINSGTAISIKVLCLVTVCQILRKEH